MMSVNAPWLGVRSVMMMMTMGALEEEEEEEEEEAEMAMEEVVCSELARIVYLHHNKDRSRLVLKSVVVVLGALRDALMHWNLSPQHPMF